MKRTIVSVGYPLARAGVDAVGGAEQVLTAIDVALVRAGHRSIVVAPVGSRVVGELVPLPPVPRAIAPSAGALARRSARRVLDAIVATEPVDVVHFHGVDFVDYLPESPARLVATLHLPLDHYPESLFEHRRVERYCVSRTQALSCRRGAVVAGVVPNGVDTSVLVPAGRKRSFAVALGRICPEKAQHRAIDAAIRAEVPIVLGGEVFGYDAHRAYFAREIAPRLGPGRVFVGPVGLARKRRLLAAARCLVVTSEIDETSSLVAMEALACGTPVVATRRGALSEIVDDGVTGFVVDDEPSLVDAIRRAPRLDPGACRRAAVERFSVAAMTERWLAVLDR